MDLLLSRLINKTERDIYQLDYNQKLPVAQINLVDHIALQGDTHKPYYWNLAAGYLHALNGEYETAKRFYEKAKTQLPKNDSLIEAQYRLLSWSLYVSSLKKVDPKAETEMVSTLNWLADLRDSKDTINNLRYQTALSGCVNILSNCFKEQGDLLRSNCFQYSAAFYANSENIEAMKSFLGKSNKTPFEKVMLRFYFQSTEDLNYQQGLLLVYQEKTNLAIDFFKKSGKNANKSLLANPFNIRINDCHDCDNEAIQAKRYTPLSIIKTINVMTAQIAEGKNLYINNYLLANVYYNITYYGNARYFYAGGLTYSMGNRLMNFPTEFRSMLTSAKIAEKYYLRARAAAINNEQKARCTFMAAKCNRNDIYTSAYNDLENSTDYDWSSFYKVAWGKYFVELNQQYSNTAFYNEILEECSYFKSYTNQI